MTEEMMNDATNEIDDVPASEVMDEPSPTNEEEKKEELSVEEQLALANEEAARNFDLSLRAQAELANARKRFEKQQIQAYTNANVDLVSKVLPVLDDFDRAIESVPEPIQEDGWFAGIELVHRKFLNILDNLNVKEIEALGQPFDPNFHDALAQEPSDEHDSGTVVRVMIKGYQIGNKVVRPALVTVAE